MNTRKLLTGLAVLALSVFLAAPAFAQNRTSFAGLKNAFDYAYGVNPNVSPLVIGIGNSATGSQTITLQYGNVTLGDGTVIAPVSAGTVPTKITVGLGANAESVTPTSVSCATPTTYNSCTVTATFANTHGQGEPVASATIGIAEAVNAAHTTGGLVAVGGAVIPYTSAGTRASALTLIGTVKGWTNVSVLDWMGTTGALSYMPTGPADGGLYVTSTHVIY